MQYPTPQFIESEGKIIYFLTYKQFFLLVAAGGVAAMFYYTLPFPFFVLCSLTVSGPILMIAFIKVHNESVIKIFLNFLGFLADKKTYVWKKRKTTQVISGHNKNDETADKQKITETQMVPFPAAIQESRLKEVKKRIETKR